jgi:hypothetical protein
MTNTSLAVHVNDLFPNVGETPISWWKDKDARLAENHKAIVNLNTGKLYSIVSKDYRLIRHEEAIKEIEAAIHRTKGLGPYELETAFYNQGGRMRRTYRFVGVAHEVEPGDFVNPELRLLNSYDQAWPFVVDLGAYRQVCSNGLVIGVILLQLRKRHVSELNRLDLTETVQTALEQFGKATLLWQDWAQRPLTEETYNHVIEGMDLGINATKEIEGQIRAESEGRDSQGFPIMTLWAFFNVLCWYATHRTISLNHRVEMERRLKAAMRHFMS